MKVDFYQLSRDPADKVVPLLTRNTLKAGERLLVVSVMLANQNAPRGERFRDGVMTRRGTFQKYFTQAEIRAYLVAALDEEPIPVAPGVLYVFRDKDAEQRFLAICGFIHAKTLFFQVIAQQGQKRRLIFHDQHRGLGEVAVVFCHHVHA